MASSSVDRSTEPSHLTDISFSTYVSRQSRNSARSSARSSCNSHRHVLQVTYTTSNIGMMPYSKENKILIKNLPECKA